MVRHSILGLLTFRLFSLVNSEGQGYIKNTKQRASFIFETPLDFQESAAYDAVEPFKQIYGQNCGYNQFDRIVGGGMTTLNMHPWQVYHSVE